MRLIALVHVWLRRSAGALAARSLARLLAQRHLLFSERASDGSTSALGEAVCIIQVSGSKDTDQNMEQHQMLCTPRRSRFQWVRTEMESL